MTARKDRAQAQAPKGRSLASTDARLARLALLARALGAPDLEPAWHEPAATRWRGSLGSPGCLRLAPDGSHRLHRLQVARAAMDHAADGRWSIRIDRASPEGMLGPFAPRNEPVLGIEECLDSWPRALLLRRLFLWVDGRRVDEALAQRWPGARRDLALDRSPVVSNDLPLVPPPRDAKEALQLALRLYRQMLSSPGHGRRALAAQEASVQIAHAAAGPKDRGQALPDGQGGGPETSGADSGASPPESRTGPTNGSPQATPTGAPSIGTETRETPEEERIHATPGRPRAAHDSTDVTRHDEWDEAHRTYLRHWTTVHSNRVVGHDIQYLADVRRRHAVLARQIRRRFQRFEADAHLRERRLFEGEHIDLDSALDEWVARRRHRAPGDGRVYSSQSRRRREVSVALLLDLSGSTNFILRKPTEPPSQDSEPAPLWQVDAPPSIPDQPPRRVIDLFKEASALLCDALDGLGHRFAVFGFGGDGRENVQFFEFKDFDEDWSATQGAALAAAAPQGYTRMGAAVRHAGLRLSREPARRRLLIVISDGYPQDSDYGPRPDDAGYGVADTARALREVESSGAGTFNISVDLAAHDYLRRMCKRHNYRIVREVEALPRELLNLSRLLRVG